MAATGLLTIVIVAPVSKSRYLDLPFTNMWMEILLARHAKDGTIAGVFGAPEIRVDDSLLHTNPF